MRTLVFSMIILLSCNWKNSSRLQGEYSELELISVHQLVKKDTLNFDFSGITEFRDSIYVVADKPWNTFLYSISFDGKTWFADSNRVISSTERFDLEAVDNCNENFYFANEYTGSINVLNPDQKDFTILPINFEEHNLQPETWKNAGWEGLAIDCKNQVMYLTKERQPRDIISIDMNTWKIIERFDIPQNESNDFSDAKYQDGHLYILERNGNYITKINVNSKKVVDKYHYKHVASHPNGKLYEPEKYGMAEALLLLKDEIWIGLDNNGLEVSKHAKETYQLIGKEPVILKFKRPKGF